MQVNLNFPPARAAMLCQAFDVAPVILLRGIKIGMLERMTIAVAPAIGQLGVFPAPALQAAFLFVVGGPGASVFGHNRRFKMIRQRENKMNRHIRRTPGKSLPGIGRQPARSVGESLA
jgi:hypothetical protein